MHDLEDLGAVDTSFGFADEFADLGLPTDEQGENPGLS